MSRRQTTETRCDLCGHGGPWTRPEDFQTFDGVDLCKWCADTNRKRELSSGGHTVTFTEDDWTCTCGVTYDDCLPMFGLVYRPVWDVVPNVLNATSNFHVNRA